MLSDHDSIGWRASQPIVPLPLDVLRLVFDARDDIVISREDGTILFVNVPASEFFAYSQDELIGQPFSRLAADRRPRRTTNNGRSLEDHRQADDDP